MIGKPPDAASGAPHGDAGVTPAASEQPQLASRGDISSRRPRKETRQRTLLSGKLIIAAGAMTPDCVIRDLSTNGARVTVQGLVPVPDELGLLVIRDGALLECRVIWRRADQLGLRVTGRHDLRGADAGVHPRIQALWRELSPR